LFFAQSIVEPVCRGSLFVFGVCTDCRVPTAGVLERLTASRTPFLYASVGRWEVYESRLSSHSKLSPAIISYNSFSRPISGLTRWYANSLHPSGQTLEQFVIAFFSSQKSTLNRPHVEVFVRRKASPWKCLGLIDAVWITFFVSFVLGVNPQLPCFRLLRDSDSSPSVKLLSPLVTTSCVGFSPFTLFPLRFFFITSDSCPLPPIPQWTGIPCSDFFPALLAPWAPGDPSFFAFCPYLMKGPLFPVLRRFFRASRAVYDDFSFVTICLDFFLSVPLLFP